MWVRFDDQGQAAWFGPERIDGSEWVDDVSEDALLTMRRVDGVWVARDPVHPLEPTPEEIAALADAEYQAAVDAVNVARRQAYQQEADPLFFKWKAGEATEEDWRVARKAVRDAFPMPERA